MDEREAFAEAGKILEAYGKALYESRIAYVNSMMDESAPDPDFYADYAEPSPTYVGRRRMLKRALILIAVLVLILGMMAVSVDAVRLKLFHYSFREYPGHTKLIPSEIEEPAQRAMPDFVLEYVPDGYEMVNYEKDDSSLWIDYDNGKEQYIHFSVDYAADGGLSVDNDTFVREEARVGEYQAWYFHDDTASLIIWQMDEYLLTIDGGVRKQEIMKMAESVVKK